MLLEFKDIHKSYGESHVLKGINLEIRKGRPFAYLGRNGAGKTTSIRILMDVFKADKGEILIDGKELKRSEYRIGYLPEERGLYGKEKILSQLVYFATLRGIPKGEAKESASNLLERVGLGDWKNKKMETLSKGNQQKVQICQSMIGNPDILVLDEPFSGLDPVNSKLLMDMIDEYMTEDKYLIFSSHQMSYVEEICKDLAIINDGRIVLSGDIYQLRKEFGGDKVRIQGKGIDENLIKSMVPNGSVELKRDSSYVIDIGGMSKKEFLGNLIEKDVELELYSQYLPGVNDIFFEYTGGEEDKNE